MKIIQYLAPLVLVSQVALSADLRPEVASWLASQTNFNTWRADFVQTRALKVLKQPLVSTGQVWFASPNRFRWELGVPAQTIAVRGSSDLMVIYPRLKRVEKYPLDGKASGQWQEALSLLEAGFPRNEADVQSRYNILSQTVTNNMCALALEPRGSMARRLMPRIQIEFDPARQLLLATELHFADGSRMRNDFSNQRLNEALDAKLFAPEIPTDYKETKPLK